MSKRGLMIIKFLDSKNIKLRFFKKKDFINVILGKCYVNFMNITTKYSNIETNSSDSKDLKSHMYGEF